jgi:1-acyl-sn-glycerol-3-phosphate acyltransferase
LDSRFSYSALCDYYTEALDMIWRQKGTFTRRVVHAVISVALRIFFRRIQTSGATEVPADEPLIFVLNHPNG